jgi:hypothetical protein
MSIEEYIEAQRANLKSISHLPEFSILVRLVDKIYRHSTEIIPQDSPPRFGRFLLLGHKFFLSSAMLIAQAQPDDAAPITRRAVEMARVCFASKFNEENLAKWQSYEKRQARWDARLEGDKPPNLPPIKYDLPVEHPILDELNRSLGILSDSYVHFTPEYFASLNWKDKIESKPQAVYLSYFIAEQRVIEREFILLTDSHTKIISLIDECLDFALSNKVSWKNLMITLHQEGKKLAVKFKSDDENK